MRNAPMFKLRHRRKREPACADKGKYSTKRYAEIVKSECEQKRDVTLRVYLCDLCDFYHLTAQAFPL